MSLELSRQAGFPKLLKQPDEVVRVQLEGFPYTRIQNTRIFSATEEKEEPLLKSETPER